MITTISMDLFKEKYGLLSRIGGEHITEVAYHIIPTLIKYYNCKNFLEIGTCYGDCVKMLALNCPDLNIWTIGVNSQQYPDIRWNREDHQNWWEIGREIKDVPEAWHRIKQVIEDSRNIRPEDFPKMDFIFIDGNHNPEFVFNDTLKALQMINRGGIIFWHDWNFNEVRGVINMFGMALDIINIDKQNATFYIHK